MLHYFLLSSFELPAALSAAFSLLYDREGKEVAMKKTLSEKGRSMIEMLGVLAIIGVLSVGGIAGYSKAMEQYRINKAIDAIATIIANIRTLYASQGNYEGVDVMGALIMPDSIKTGSSDWDYNIMGNKLFYLDEHWIGPAKIKKDYDAFGLVVNGLSSKECVALATKDWGSSSSGIQAIAIGKGHITDGRGFRYMEDLFTKFISETGTVSGGYQNASSMYYAKPSKLPISPATASQQCNCVGNEYPYYGNNCYFLMLLN